MKRMLTSDAAVAFLLLVVAFLVCLSLYMSNSGRKKSAEAPTVNAKRVAELYGY